MAGSPRTLESLSSALTSVPLASIPWRKWAKLPVSSVPLPIVIARRFSVGASQWALYLPLQDIVTRKLDVGEDPRCFRYS